MYTGTEQAVDLKPGAAGDADSVFQLPLPGIPKGATPVYDDQLRAIVGYRLEVTAGVFRIYDLEGQYLGMEEVGLESPLLDPIDLLLLFGGIIRGVGKGLARASARAAAGRGTIVIGGATFSAAVTGAMRAAFRRLSVRSLKFTATTAARMATPGRYVPVHILHLAIKHGVRRPDPQKVKGAYLYTIRMLKNGKEYALEIVVREKDWTILHFLFK